MSDWRIIPSNRRRNSAGRVDIVSRTDGLVAGYLLPHHAERIVADHEEAERRCREHLLAGCDWCLSSRDDEQAGADRS
jgi:hypothetical protein